MSGQHNDLEHIHNQAIEAANGLLNDSYDCIAAFGQHHSHGEANAAIVKAIYTGFHALLTQRDIQHQANNYNKLSESERQSVYAALWSVYLAENPVPKNVDEVKIAEQRIEHISNGWCWHG